MVTFGHQPEIHLKLRVFLRAIVKLNQYGRGYSNTDRQTDICSIARITTLMESLMMTY